MRHLLYAVASLGTLGVGANLHYQITAFKAEGWGVISISLAVLSCIFILASLYFTCKLWYTEGCIATLREMRERIEKREKG